MGIHQAGGELALDIADSANLSGSPAKAVHTPTDQDLIRMQCNAANYVQRGQLFKQSLKKIG